MDINQNDLSLEQESELINKVIDYIVDEIHVEKTEHLKMVVSALVSASSFLSNDDSSPEDNLNVLLFAFMQVLRGMTKNV